MTNFIFLDAQSSILFAIVIAIGLIIYGIIYLIIYLIKKGKKPHEIVKQQVEEKHDLQKQQTDEKKDMLQKHEEQKQNLAQKHEDEKKDMSQKHEDEKQQIQQNIIENCDKWNKQVNSYHRRGYSTITEELFNSHSKPNELKGKTINTCKNKYGYFLKQNSSSRHHRHK